MLEARELWSCWTTWWVSPFLHLCAEITISYSYCRLLSSQDKISSYSLFFGDLSSRGHKLSFFHAESNELALKQYGENLYDNIVFFAPNIESFSSINFDDLQEFVQEGGSLLLGAGKDTSDSVREFAETFGINFDKKGTEVIDHFENEDSLDAR